MPLCNDTIKNREIRFELATPDQAKKAETLLSGVPGIDYLRAVKPCRLHIRYSVEELTLQMIESALREVGFALDDGLLIRLKRALISYCEDALRANIGVEEADRGKSPTLTLLRQTLQDPRRHHWRKYV